MKITITSKIYNAIKPHINNCIKQHNYKKAQQATNDKRYL